MTARTDGATSPRMSMEERWMPGMFVQTPSKVLSTTEGEFLTRNYRSKQIFSRFWSNVACVTPAPTKRTNVASSSPITNRESLEAGESLKEGQCEYTCGDTGGCTTELVVNLSGILEEIRGW